MNKKSLVFVSTVALTSLLGVSVAQAQSVDYGAAEQMFGEPVTTSATGTPQRATDVPVDMTIITADEIRRSGETGLPYGERWWIDRLAKRLKLKLAIRPRGRTRKAALNE